MLTDSTQKEIPTTGTVWRLAYQLIERVCDDLKRHVSADIGNRSLALETIDLDKCADKEHAFFEGFNHGLEMAITTIEMYRDGEIS